MLKRVLKVWELKLYLKWIISLIYNSVIDCSNINLELLI